MRSLARAKRPQTLVVFGPRIQTRILRRSFHDGSVQRDAGGERNSLKYATEPAESFVAGRTWAPETSDRKILAQVANAENLRRKIEALNRCRYVRTQVVMVAPLPPLSCTCAGACARARARKRAAKPPTAMGLCISPTREF